ncbi:MAG: DUF4870 domain-containing protein [Desulfobacterales bacterium]|nr:DUF4870 domain-containing protein [Desulfobacterales bacterium]
MSEKQYVIEFSGQIIPGWEIEEVKANMANLLKADDSKISRLFSGKRFVIKKNVDQQNAFKINEAFKNAGADLILTEIPNISPAAPPPIPSQEGPGESHQPPTAVVQPALAPADIRPTRIWYIVAILLFVFPMIVGGAVIFNAIALYFSGGMQLMVPGETTLQVEEAGTYLIFYETSVFSENNIGNVRYGRDFEIALMDLATGQGLQLNPPEFGGTETYGATVRQAIAEVEFDTSGDYYAEVFGELPGNDGLLVRRVDFIGMIKGIVSAIVLFFIGFIVGPIMALVVLIKRQNYKRKQMNETMGEEEERKWAMFAHIGTFSSMFIPLGNIIAPIVIWQIKKKESAFVVDQAKESLNFQITLMIYAVISFLLVFIIIGFFLIFGLVIFSLIIVIVAGVKANEGEHYRYPMTLRLIS